ncbi:methyl-accepting chemotaxis protein [Methylobacter sp.]|uniref:methyl-accepting chemotaxis protein n=1 Tax=Methylobacter sp. TaxID=2051955 RepID=UPI002489E906|nr:methyl-accepting chemotaxis protein [Methylobacter sp.]MDI1277961.1 methyl-accepting chemotaxis protein [Methylobacter sp.]MDI1358784.1 methyl-accepting chemotaxis protein [Methylobacter sp.]
MLKYISFKARILLGFLAIISLMTVISASSLINLSNTERDLTEINNNLLPNALLMGQMARDIVLVHQFLSDVSASHSPAGYGDSEKSAQDFKQGLLQFREHIVGNSGKLKDVDILEANFDLFYQDGKRMALAYTDEGPEAGNAVMQDFDHESYKLSSQMIKLRNTEVNAAKYHVNNITETTHQVSAVLWTLSLAIITLALGIALFLTRHLSKQIGIDPLYAKGIAKEIAKGDLSRSIQLEADDKDSLLHAIKNMQQKLLASRTAEHKAAEEILRIKIALDNTSIGIMIADNERNIIYANKSVVNALGKIEAEIRKQIPSFSADTLVGNNMDVFYQNPAQQAKSLATLSGAHSDDIELAGRTITVVANPVISQQDERIGTVTEWHDRTAEVAVEKEVSAIVVAACTGDFTQRIELRDKAGFLHELGEGLNQILHTSETGLNEVVRVLGALSCGDLTETITNDYQGTFGQLKDNTNATVEKLKSIIHQIKDATDCINTGAKEIASGNSDLSHRTEEQAASLEQTAASMEELTANVQHNTENAKQTNLLAIGAAEIADQGGAVVGQVVATMNDIKDSSLKIEEIISVIDDIAFQINILAINAAIEAARAGTHGQGFAVVAGEVRNLAQRAAASAGEIKILIEDAVKKIDDGSGLAAQAGKTMEEVLNSIRGVTGMMSKITAASVEQSAGIEQVNLAINQMDYVTQQNAALVDQAAAAAESLEEQAQNLAITVSGFKIANNPTGRNAFYAVDAPVITLPEIHPSHPHREHKEHVIWNTIRSTGSNALHNLENAAAAKSKPQLLAIANGDWEEF